jgi:hypothetical protein
MQQEELKERKINIRYGEITRLFNMPFRHKFEEFKYMLEDIFKF